MKELHWYELTERGFSLGTQPSGFVDKDFTHVNGRGREYGAVAYEQELSDSDLEHYAMVKIQK